MLKCISDFHFFKIGMCLSNMTSALLPLLPLSHPPGFFHSVLPVVLLQEEEQGLPCLCSWIKPVLQLGQALTFVVLTVFKRKCFIRKSVFANTKQSERDLYRSLWIHGLTYMLCKRNSRQTIFRISSHF